MKVDDARLRGLSATEGLVSLQGPTNILERLIISMRALYSCDRLDISHGSMSSSTAEALVYTFMDALQFLQAYSSHMGHSEITDSICLKCMTTRLIRVFFWTHNRESARIQSSVHLNGSKAFQ